MAAPTSEYHPFDSVRLLSNSVICLDLGGKTELSPAKQVATSLRQEILQTEQPSPESLIIFHLVNGHTSPHLAAIDLLITITQAHKPSELLTIITTDLASVVTEYPTLHPQLIALVSAIYSLSSSTPQRSAFLSSLSSSLGDLTQANYGNLFENNQDGSDLVRDHVTTHGFYARLLDAVGHVQIPNERISGLDDALFILRNSLEAEETVHGNSNIDIPAAAMYMIHAGNILFKESQKG